MLHQAITRLAAAGYHHIGMDHFVKPGDELSVAQRNGSLHRNFQGYTAHAQCDSIGFGVSAYSQVGDNFSQNATSLESYHDRLDHAQLPVIRGYQSDDDDLLRRDIIQSLLCQFRLDPAAIGRKWEIDFAEYFSDELAQLEKLERDGLVRISDSEIAVSEAGRLLVCGICMIFDRYQRMENVSGLDSQSD
jgi:oxygen-independent coproporphyrinogen-3 oxidase